MSCKPSVKTVTKTKQSEKTQSGKGAKTGPLKILFLDIEASNLSASMGYVLAIGYKWAHEKTAKVMSLSDYPGKKSTDDKNLLVAFERVYEQADIVVHHFGDFYDIPFLQTRRIIHGLLPMSKITSVDTWRIAKKRLRFHSNRLNAILRALGCPYSKTELDGNIWIDASAGDRRALNYVVKHCYYDVLVLEWVYNHIRGVWDQHPLVHQSKDDVCRICKTAKPYSLGLRPSGKYVYRRRQCRKCGFSWKGERVD